ncbi:hypothetical protein HOY34_08670 [Xinfangfangia sp. D13-10-4-6]|uniref:hypothetical protein n=1 Tax=Pseudogemmobacter hezensis TaxID=2737662 RepID=UPI0015539B5D|nr:hypothetical protein [Pseudogemmobacter hezensis]NPD15271.1 hypothetical protein [Pseudogemmobacter hezensis]
MSGPFFKWAHDEERLAENIAETVRQAAPKRIRNRERGYTAEEAVVVLKACRGYEPKADEFGRVHEPPESVAAKRWAPVETWASTPAEINLAVLGHVKKLTAMSGNPEPKRSGPTKEQRQANVAAGLDPDFDRDGLARLRSMR